MTQPPFFVYCPFDSNGNNPVNLGLCLRFFKTPEFEIYFDFGYERNVWNFPTEEDRDKAWEYLRDLTDPERINQRATAHGWGFRRHVDKGAPVP